MSESEQNEEKILEKIDPDAMQRLNLSVESLKEFIQKVPSIEETCADQATAA